MSVHIANLIEGTSTLTSWVTLQSFIGKGNPHTHVGYKFVLVSFGKLRHVRRACFPVLLRWCSITRSFLSVIVAQLQIAYEPLDKTRLQKKP